MKCLYPNQCGIGMDCKECYQLEIQRLQSELDAAKSRINILDSFFENIVFAHSELFHAMGHGEGFYEKELKYSFSPAIDSFIRTAQQQIKSLENNSDENTDSSTG